MFLILKVERFRAKCMLHSTRLEAELVHLMNEKVILLAQYQ